MFLIPGGADVFDARHADRMSGAGNKSTIDEPVDFLALLQLLWRGKPWILLAAVIGGLLGYAYLRYGTVPKFSAQAVVALENRTSTVVDLESVVTGLSRDMATVNTELEVLRSRGLIGQLVDELDLLGDPEFNRALDAEGPAPDDALVRDATINAVLGSLTAGNVRGSYVYTLSAVTTRPEKSQRLVNTLADLYIRDQLSAKYDATARATAWLTERVTGLKADLEAAEAQVKGFAATTTLVSPEALEALNRQIKESRIRLSDLDATRRDLAARVAALEAVQASGDREAMRRAANDPALERIVAAEPESTLFESRFAAVLDRARLDLGRSEAQATSLRASITTLESDYDRQSNDLVTLEQLQREAEASRTIYEYFLTRLKETSVQEGIQQPDSRVLSYAPLPRAPSEPRRSRIMALYVLIGLLAGVAGVLLREMTHTGFRSAEELEAESGIAVMGQIPRIPSRDRAGVIRYLSEKPTSAAAEAVRNLRTSVLLSHVDRPPQVIQSSSSLSAEGKTTNAIALAQNFAGLGRRVLLIEGDIRRRVFNLYFGIGQERGLLAVLSGEAAFDDVVVPVEAIGCDVLIGEQSSTNAADVFSSERFTAFMRGMRERYDIIIIDTPPVLLVPDARIIAKVTDAVLFTVLWDKTSRAQVRESIRQLELAGVKITGMVLSQIDPKGMKRYGYGNRYGAYAGYGSKYYSN